MRSNRIRRAKKLHRNQPYLIAVLVFCFSLARRTHRCVSNRIRRATSEQVTLVPIFYAIKISHPLHCSSFSQKSAARQGCSLVLYSSALPSLTTFLRSPALHHNQPYLIAVLVFCCQPCEENAQVRLESHQACHVGTSYACSDFLCYKNQSPAPLFLLFAKKCRSARLLACTVLVSLAFADNFFAVTGFAPQSTVFDCGACFLLSALRGERTQAGFAICRRKCYN